MVSEKKKRVVSDVGKEIKEYPVIGILDMFKLPASQLDEIRNSLREMAKIKMVKKRLMKRILNNCGLKGADKLCEYLQGEPAFLFSNTDPFKLAIKLSRSKSPAPAKAGDIAPKDIIIKAGPTSLSAGPVIGELQRLKIPAGVEGEKIFVKQDTVIAKKGDVISSNVAGMLSKLGIKPMEIGLNLIAALEDGIIYEKDVLFTDPDEYLGQLRQACSDAFNLSVHIGYVTKENVSALLSKGYRQACVLADEAGIITKDNAPKQLARGAAHAKALKDKAKIEETEQSGKFEKKETEGTAGTDVEEKNKKEEKKDEEEAKNTGEKKSPK